MLSPLQNISFAISGTTAVQHDQSFVVGLWIQPAVNRYPKQSGLVSWHLACLQVVVLCIPGAGGQVGLHVLYVLRLARLVRVFKLLTVRLRVRVLGVGVLGSRVGLSYAQHPPPSP